MELKEAYGLKKDLETIINNLETKTDLFDKNKKYELENKVDEIERGIERETNENRVLCVGIIGSVKAGKSSFLNACIFDGDGPIPKAVTSTTAALTKITYSKEEGATIYFYSKEDWDIVEEKTEEYKSRLESEYNLYINDFNESNRESNKNKVFANNHSERKSPMDKDSYEKNIFRKGAHVSDEIASAYELYQMAEKKHTDLSLLDSDPISIERNQLKDYVAGDGIYTPIVKWAELRIDDEIIEGMEIIDTPGLNDPIVSRSMVTKKFLRDCDVVILLSPCSQFMDANTIRLMSHALPSSNVRDIVIVGSKLDFGILNENSKEFSVACKTSIDKYDKQFQNSIKSVLESEFADKNVVNMKEKEPFYISSICFSIAKKIERGEAFDKEEAHIHNLLIKRFDGVENNAEFFKEISGINDIKDEFAKARINKQEIIMEKSRDEIASLARAILFILNDIHNESLDKSTKIQQNSLEELKDQYNMFNEAINRSRRKLSALFTNAGLDSVKRINGIKNRIIDILENYQNIKIETRSRQELETYSHGLLGFKKDVQTITITNYYASTAQVKINVERYAAKASQVINDDFNYLFNAEQLSNSIKEVVLEVFHEKNGDYNEDDILVPLSTVINRIQIPSVKISTDQFIDQINSIFPTGSAVDNDVHRLRSVQASILSSIKNNMCEQLDRCKDEITKMMEVQSVSFADEIEKKNNGDLENLTLQIKNKEEYIKKYAEFINEIIDYKKIVSKYN